MGQAFSNFFRKLFGKKQVRVLLLGLDSAGKTTILFQMSGKNPHQTVPTVGFNVETIKFENVELVVWDVAGQDKLRPFWRHYYRGTSGVIFVVDSVDERRLSLAKKELHSLIAEEELQKATVLVLANKQDQPGALAPDEVAKRLDLQQLGRQTNCMRTIATTGEGLKDAFHWLSHHMDETAPPKKEEEKE